MDAEHLGVSVGSDGSAVMMWSNEGPTGTGMTVWSTFSQESTYFGPQKGAVPQALMIHYRVDDLTALLARLGAAGFEIDPKRDDQSYGRFAWVYDCDGNRIELWQPLGEDNQASEASG